MPATFTIGSSRLLVKPPGPVQEKETPGVLFIPFKAMPFCDPQVSVPPVASASGAFTSSSTSALAVLVQPLVPVTVST